MEIETLVDALEETISYLRNSHSFAGASMPVEEIVRRLEAELAKARSSKPVDIILLDRLFAPTGAIQEISIDNGWGSKFLRLSEVIDQFTAN